MSEFGYGIKGLKDLRIKGFISKGQSDSHHAATARLDHQSAPDFN